MTAVYLIRLKDWKPLLYRGGHHPPFPPCQAIRLTALSCNVSANADNLKKTKNIYNITCCRSSSRGCGKVENAPKTTASRQKNPDFYVESFVENLLKC